MQNTKLQTFDNKTLIHFQVETFFSFNILINLSKTPHLTQLFGNVSRNYLTDGTQTGDVFNKIICPSLNPNHGTRKIEREDLLVDIF